MRGVTGLVFLALTASVAAQTPQPFPAPRNSQPVPTSAAPQAPKPPVTAAPQTTKPAPPATTAAQPAAAKASAPAAPNLGDVPLYPNAVYLTSYDAGRGQRFHLYGVLLPYAEAVAYYRTALKVKGDELFESPPTHQFDLGRFRDAEMAFPPSVTVKDYTWGGAAGYVNPTRGAQPERFPTVIQIVLAPPVK